MKRFCILLLCAVLILSLFGGCGKRLSDHVETQEERISSETAPDTDRFPQETGDKETEKKDTEDGARKVVQVVSSLYSSNFAVLYDDGTVGVGVLTYSGYEEEIQAYAPVQQWRNVKKLFFNQGTVIGLMEDGTVRLVGPYFDEEYQAPRTEDLAGVVDIVSLEPDQDFFFLLEDGTVEYRGAMFSSEEDVRFGGVHEDWEGVRELVSYYYYDIFGIFEDGSVAVMGGEDVSAEAFSGWSDIRKLYFGNKFYGLREDGSLVVYDPYPDYSPQIPNETRSLKGAVELYPVGDVVFGLTEEGSLLVSGGEDWFLNEYYVEKSSGIDWTDFSSIKQLVASNAMGLDYVIALREDGSVISLNQEWNPYLAYLTEVERLCVTYGYDGTALICGTQKDGNVVGVEILPSGSAVIHKDNFRDWQVEDIYATEYGILLGFCRDGSIVTSYELTDTEIFQFLPPA